ncbi:hypothetical protein EG329_008215 [Mollisiaceae sp. DMI_Dod_QoI]|nr:hypothetical protein EG329_008215 [Helotiales sp. DMI_Dod_QoI]
MSSTVPPSTTEVLEIPLRMHTLSYSQREAGNQVFLFPNTTGNVMQLEAVCDPSPSMLYHEAPQPPPPFSAWANIHEIWDRPPNPEIEKQCAKMKRPQSPKIVRDCGILGQAHERHEGLNRLRKFLGYYPDDFDLFFAPEENSSGAEGQSPNRKHAHHFARPPHPVGLVILDIPCDHPMARRNGVFRITVDNLRSQINNVYRKHEDEHGLYTHYNQRLKLVSDSTDGVDFYLAPSDWHWIIENVGDEHRWWFLTAWELWMPRYGEDGWEPCTECNPPPAVQASPATISHLASTEHSSS